MTNMELETDIEALDMEMGDVTIHYCPVIPNPEGEPTAELKTADIEGTIYEIVDEEARTSLENKVDKEEGKGLSENDYTDEDKAIVGGVTTALNGKVDKDGDKVLSDNNYSDNSKDIVDSVGDFPNENGYYTLDVQVSNNENRLYWRRLPIPSNNLYPSNSLYPSDIQEV